uniref:Uncharacterized protein n=1 Tax=Aegilops tauschii subsp. strangulata TaxID=200361 RepID=A0A453BIM9_AEGTS
MEKDAVLVCMILGFLGSVAVTLGFVANNYSSKAWIQDQTSQFSFHQFDRYVLTESMLVRGVPRDDCVYLSPLATGLGILGVFLVFINQVIVAGYASGWCLCLCCCCPYWTKRCRLAPTPSKWNPV